MEQFISLKSLEKTSNNLKQHEFQTKRIYLKMKLGIIYMKFTFKRLHQRRLLVDHSGMDLLNIKLTKTSKDRKNMIDKVNIVQSVEMILHLHPKAVMTKMNSSL